MLENIDTPSERLMLIAVWGLVLMLWCGGGLYWMLRRDVKLRRLRRRIGVIEDGGPDTPTKVLRLWRDSGEEASTVVPHSSRVKKLLASLHRLPQDAGWDMSIWLLLTGASVALAFLMIVTWAATHSVIAGIAMAIIAGTAMGYFVQHKIQRRRAAFERQFEDAMTLIARSLRAGQPLLGAFQLVADEMDAPISNVFNEIVQQQALGLSLDESIRRVAAAHDNQDLNLFATSVVIQLRTGGNLADMMQRLAMIVRERLKLLRRIRVLTAQTQYSKRVLLVLPLLMFVLLTAMNPKYMEPMYGTRMGMYLSAAAIASMAMGAWMMNKMAKVQP